MLVIVGFCFRFCFLLFFFIFALMLYFWFYDGSIFGSSFLRSRDDRHHRGVSVLRSRRRGHLPDLSKCALVLFYWYIILVLFFCYILVLFYVLLFWFCFRCCYILVLFVVLFWFCFWFHNDPIFGSGFLRSRDDRPRPGVSVFLRLRERGGEGGHFFRVCEVVV